MKLSFLIFVVFCIFAKVASGETFRCYECDGDDCNSKETMKLGVCSDPDEPEMTTVNEWSSTAIGTSEAPSTAINETVTEAQPSTKTTANTTTAAATTTITEVPITTTTNSMTTIVPKSATTTIVSPTTTTTNSATTITPESTTTTIVSPSTTTEVVSSRLEGSSTTIDASTTTIGVSAMPATTTLNQETTVNTETATSPTGAFGEHSPADILIRSYRAISRQRSHNDNGYACYTVKYKDEDDNSDVKMQKGCIQIDEMKTGCESVKDKLEDEKIVDCVVCMNSECNSSATVKLAMLSVIIFTVARFV